MLRSRLRFTLSSIQRKLRKPNMWLTAESLDRIALKRKHSYRDFKTSQLTESRESGANYFSAIVCSIKPGLHEPQLPVERSVTLLSFIAVERRRCARTQQRRSTTRE